MIEKIITQYSAKDSGIYLPNEEARERVATAKDFEALADLNRRYWGCTWANCDIKVESSIGPDINNIIHFNIFHVLQTLPLSGLDDIGLTARGIHGEAYQGHVFWDELFIFPYLVTHLPQIARQLIMYRYHRLDQARLNARRQGYEGAMFPWRSASDGREVTPAKDRNPLTGEWLRDMTYLQRHINGAIAYIIYLYGEVTGDRPFMATYGLEILVEIARFWASMASYSEKRQCYEIHDVMGPDEFHDAYPGAAKLGLKSNAYSNLIAAWTLQKSACLIEELNKSLRREMILRLNITLEESQRWQEIGRHMYVPFIADGLLEQFESFHDLEDLDLENYKRRNQDIRRIDYLLDREGDSANRYKVAKQVDVLMLFYLFPESELVRLFASLGYRYNPSWIKKNLDYYLARTTSGSTISQMVHSWILARINHKKSKEDSMSHKRVISIGSINLDVQVMTRRWAEPGETLMAEDSVITGGGKGANVALMAARLGSPSILISQAGDDLFHDIALAQLKKAGIDLSGVGIAKGKNTGLSIIITRPDADKNIFLAGNANDQWPDEARERV